MKAIPIAEYLNRIDQSPTRERLGGPMPVRSVKRGPVNSPVSLVARPQPRPSTALDREGRREPSAGRPFVVDLEALSDAVDVSLDGTDAEATTADGEPVVDAGPQGAGARDLVEAVDIDALVAERMASDNARIADEIRAGLAEIETRVSDAVAKLLIPFVDKRLTTQIVESLADCLRSLAADQRSGVVVVRGPERLLERLKARAANVAIAVEYLPEARVEVSIATGNTHVESQLLPWGALLASID